MEEKLLLYIGMTVFTIVTFFIFPVLIYVFYFRSKRKKEVCTAVVTGEVKRYSFISYNGMSLPVVGYWVDNVYYTEVGPRFQSVRYQMISTPWNSIHTEQEHTALDRDHLPEKLTVYRKQNSFISFTANPLQDLFPVGSLVDVYYNPKKPKQAYVHRHVVAMSKGVLILFVVIQIVYIIIYILFWILILNQT